MSPIAKPIEERYWSSTSIPENVLKKQLVECSHYCTGAFKCKWFKVSFFFFSPSKLYSSRVRHLISGSSISTGSERRSVSAYNGIKWADLKAGPEWETALRVLFYAFAWKFTHSRNFDPPLVDFFASLAITCMWKGRKVSTSRGEPEWSEYKMGIAFFDIMVLTELSHKLFFPPFFCRKTLDSVCVYVFGKLSARRPSVSPCASASVLWWVDAPCSPATAKLENILRDFIHESESVIIMTMQ